jgi:hypothetical protein
MSLFIFDFPYLELLRLGSQLGIMLSPLWDKEGTQIRSSWVSGYFAHRSRLPAGLYRLSLSY